MVTKSELKAELAKTRAELRAEMATKSELKAESAATRAEIRAKLADFEAELRRDLQATIRAGIAEAKRELKSTVMWVAGFVIFMQIGLFIKIFLG